LFALQRCHGRVLGNCIAAIAPASSVSFSTPSKRTCLKHLEIHLILDNTVRTKRPCSGAGWPSVPLSFALHANFGLVVELGRTLVCNLTEKQIRRGVHRSTVELENAIRHFIEHHNQNPKLSCGQKPPIRFSNCSALL